MITMKQSIFAVGIAGLITAGPGLANVNYAYAQVVDVEPLHEIVSVTVPTEVCRDHEVAYQAPRRRSATAPVLGAVIGGAIGHAVGHRKRNKQVGAVTGALLGGAIGADINRRNSYRDGSVHYRTERVCHSDTEVREEERQAGYRVSYLYGGETYTTHMNQHPGESIRVRVAVSPVGR
ncbi:MAG: glycine zipper 2TM domain-containing protein [Pseudomonadales bacterium]